MRLLPIAEFALLLLLKGANSLGATPQVDFVPLVKEWTLGVLVVRIDTLLCRLTVLLSYGVESLYAARQLAIVTTPPLRILYCCSCVLELLKTILINCGVLVIEIPLSPFVRQANDATTSL